MARMPAGYLDHVNTERHPRKLEELRTHASGGSSLGPPPESFLNLPNILRRHRIWIIGLVVGCLAAGAAFTAFQTPVYEARASLEYSPVQTPALRDGAAAPPADTVESAFQTQVGLLQNEALIRNVVRRLKLEARPEFQRATGASVLSKLSRTPAPNDSPEETSVKTAMKNLAVHAQARIIFIAYDSPDPQLAAEFVNTLAAELVRQNHNARSDAATRASEWLSAQAVRLKQQADTYERQLEANARTAGLLLPGEHSTVAGERLLRVSDELSRAQADRIAKQAAHELAASAPPEALPEVLDDGPLKEYRVKLSDLRRQLAESSALLAPSHYKVRQIKNQIQTIEAELANEVANVRKRIDNEYKSAQAREHMLVVDYQGQTRAASDLAAKAIYYNALKQEAETARALYTTTLQKAQEISITAALPASNIRMLGEARPPSLPSKPNAPLNLSLALFAGLFSSAMYVMIRERSDTTFKAPGEAAAFVGLPELAAIPAAPAVFRTSPTLLSLSSGRSGDESVPMAKWAPGVPLLAESFREVVASLCMQYDMRSLVIVLTSPGQGEGKTTIASNLAVTLTCLNRRVLLIDADLRRPRLHKLFKLPNTTGFSNLLLDPDRVDGPSADSLVHAVSIPGLFVLPSGPYSPPGAPDDAAIPSALHGSRLDEVLAGFRSRFDLVLVDAPPALHGPDARLLGHAADGVILVVRARKTSRDALAFTASRFVRDDVRLLGTILNDWDPKTDSTDSYGAYYTVDTTTNR